MIVIYVYGQPLSLQLIEYYKKYQYNRYQTTVMGIS